GVVWGGSPRRGHGDAMSDDDLEVLLTPEAFARLAPVDSYDMERDPDADPPKLIYDAQLTSLAVLQSKAASSRDLDHWPYERSPILFDRDGAVTAAVRAAAVMAPAFRQARLLHGALDTTLAIGRARKTGMRGFPAATAMLVARGAKALSRVIFALEDRWVPLDHWLEPELGTLADPVGAAPRLIQALVETRHEPLQAALERLQPQLEAIGFPPAAQRATFFSEIMHADRAAERAVHGLN
ncbi:MAG: hypothetical protein ACK46X_18230, partial [Candidatus Sericytochromatia bacterium]